MYISLAVFKYLLSCSYLVMASNGETAPEGNEQEGASIDPIWTSSRTARQIMALMEVEKVRTNGKLSPIRAAR